MLAPENRQAVWIQVRYDAAAERDRTERRRIHAGQGVHQRRFAGTAGTHYNSKITLIKLQVDIF